MGFNANDNMPTSSSQLKNVRGVVVDNKDPLKLRRVRCKVQGIIEGSDVAALPWCKPVEGNGGRVDFGDFSVPDVNSIVEISFPDNDKYNPYYKSMSDDCTHTSLQRLFGESYPNSYGRLDESGTWQRINKEQLYAEFFHAAGLHIKTDSNGNLHLFVPKNLIIHVGDNFCLNATNQIGLVCGKDFGISSGEDVGIKAASTFEVVATEGTIETPTDLHLNCGVEFGTADSTKTLVNTQMATVKTNQGTVKALQSQIKKAGAAAKSAITSIASGLLGTRGR